MKLVVGVADMKISSDPADMVITYSLGSCIAVCIYDRVSRVGGILHFMLPESKIAPEKASANPFMFADTGIPIFFREAYRFGAVKGRLEVKAAGGAQIMDPAGTFNIGKRNILALRKIFWQNGVILSAAALGGEVNRTVALELECGRLSLKTSGDEPPFL